MSEPIDLELRQLLTLAKSTDEYLDYSGLEELAKALCRAVGFDHAGSKAETDAVVDLLSRIVESALVQLRGKKHRDLADSKLRKFTLVAAAGEHLRLIDPENVQLLELVGTMTVADQENIKQRLQPTSNKTVRYQRAATWRGSVWFDTGSRSTKKALEAILALFHQRLTDDTERARLRQYLASNRAKYLPEEHVADRDSPSAGANETTEPNVDGDAKSSRKRQSYGSSPSGESVRGPGSGSIGEALRFPLPARQHLLDDGLINIARRLAAHIKANLIDQETVHNITDPTLPVEWIVVQDKRADHWPNVRRDSDVEPSMLNGRFPYIAQTFDLVKAKRLVILGQPGSGKTIVASHLALELLERAPLGKPPVVPVIVNLASWSKDDRTFWPWFTRHFSEQYCQNIDGQRSRKSSYELARQLVRSRLVLPILDGFDEMDAELRPHFTEALHRETGGHHSIVLTSRVSEYNAVVENSGPLTSAAVIQICDLDPHRVLDDYLELTSPPVRIEGDLSNWRLFATAIRSGTTTRREELLDMLKVPFMISLFRETYRRPGSDPRELLDEEQFPNSAAVNSRLLAGYLAATYHDADSDKAKRLLNRIAKRVKENGEHDIAWWSLCTPPIRVLRSGGVHWAALLGCWALLAGLIFFTTRVELGVSVGFIDIAAVTVALFGGLMGILSILFLLPYEPVMMWQEDRDARPRSVRFEKYFEFLVHHAGIPPRIRYMLYVLGIAYLIGAATYRVLVGSFNDGGFFLVVMIVVFGIALWHELIPQSGVSRLIPVYQARAWFMLESRTCQSPNSFLRDAYKRGVLRRAGAVYQFRHELLREYLETAEEHKPL